MSTEANKEIVRRFFEEAWNQNKVAELEEYISANNVTHPGTLTWPFGPESAAQLMKIWRTGLPDYQCQIHEMIAEGNTVTTRITFWGTHTGPFDVASRTLHLQVTKYTTQRSSSFTSLMEKLQKSGPRGIG